MSHRSSRSKRTQFNWVPWVGVGVFAVFVVKMMSDPSLAHGRAMGSSYLFVALGLLAFCTAAATWVWSLWYGMASRPSSRRTLGFFTLVLFSAYALNAECFYRLDQDYHVVKAITANKIRYFCHENFQLGYCVTFVNRCPTCMAAIGKFEREQMAAKLRTFQVLFPAGVSDGAAAAPLPRGPATALVPTSTPAAMIHSPAAAKPMSMRPAVQPKATR